jgi:dethiobiotin synthetase
VSAVFITSTGTDIGKTFVTAGLIHTLRRRGRAVDAVKPALSGFTEAIEAASDAGVLLTALGRPLGRATLDRLSPWRFEAPLSPDMAARREGRRLDFEALLAFSRQAVAAAEDVLLIEGIGGIMVPLDDEHTVLDWMAALGLPLFLVVGSYLGSLSHSLTAFEVLTRRGLRVEAMVVSESAGSTVDLDETAATLARFAATIPVVALPRLSGPSTAHPAFDRLAALL